MLLLTAFIAAGTIVSAIAIRLQWHEMVNGGADTKAIADAAKKQACAAQHFADTAALINGGIGGAVDKLGTQAKATQRAAKAAENASKTAQETLNISQRAYIVTRDVFFDESSKVIVAQVRNDGRIPTGRLDIVAHYVVFDLSEPIGVGSQNVTRSYPHWKPFTWANIGLSNVIDIYMPLKEVSIESLKAAKQTIVVVLEISYDDGIPNAPKQTTQSCSMTNFQTTISRYVIVPCDPAEWIPKLEKLDGYPSPQNEEIRGKNLWERAELKVDPPFARKKRRMGHPAMDWAPG